MRLPLPSIGPLPFSASPSSRGVLRQLDEFGSNPGQLKALYYRPEQNSAGKPPLVVVLHGCTQTAASYDHGSGWSELASEYGFATLFPEQQRANNPSLCFNWFQPGDMRRGAGEARSIAQMIDTMVEQHHVDAQRIFITGLSAGGAMTSVMLAAYPELFAGGAIVAGLPYGAASSVPEALQQMRAPSRAGATSGRSVREASPHKGPWPTISVWHGTADTVISPLNADAIVSQWQEVHAVSRDAAQNNQVNGNPRRAWHDASGKLVIEEYRVTGMAHGTPLATTGACGCGQAGPFMLEVGISSTVLSAETWGLLNERTSKRREEAPSQPRARSYRLSEAARPRVQAGAPDRITRIIEDALKSAGLLK